MTGMTCPISSHSMEPVFAATVLGKYPVTYYHCKACGLLKTEQPYWLAEAYEEAINASDTGLVARNLQNGNALEVILSILGLAEGRFLDVAGGYGLLTRLMRDKGFDCYTTDKYCKNLFARMFEPEHGFRADALFAFEVLEHLDDPMRFLSAAFESYGNKTIVFSTLTFGETIPPKDWWYYSFEEGQHITFYQPKTLSYLAGKLSCRYYWLSSGLHLMTDRKIDYWALKTLTSNKLYLLASAYVRRQRRGLSKTWEDNLKMKAQLKERIHHGGTGYA